MTEQLAISRNRRHDWGPRQPRVSRDYVLDRLADTSATLVELARELGYSPSWLQHLGAMHCIPRKRGGDRRSDAARARFCRA